MRKANTTAGVMLAGLLVAVTATNAGASVSAFGRVRGSQQIGSDQLQGTGEADTTTEPWLAMDPNNDLHLISVYQQGRYEDGGSVGPGFSTSADGGRTWTSGNLPGLTTATGGPYDRASDAGVAFGPDGEAYAVSLELSNGGSPPTAVGVNRSDDGGLTWRQPVFVEKQTSILDDKTVIAVDDFPSSPHMGRVYTAWDRNGATVMLSHSDDRGQTWSTPVTVSDGSTPGFPGDVIVQPNGNVSVQWPAPGKEVIRTSADGGQTFTPIVTIGSFQGIDPPDMRTGGSFGLGGSGVDPVTGALYMVWQDTRFRTDGLNDIVMSVSADHGQTWSAPSRVNQDAPNSKLDHFTPWVAADSGFVHVFYYQRDNSHGLSKFVNPAYIHSEDGGATWRPVLRLGPAIDITYAADAEGGKFLGDYEHIVADGASAHAVWSRASKPAQQQTYHQTTWSAVVLHG